MPFRERWAEVILDAAEGSTARLVLVRQALPAFDLVESGAAAKPGWHVRRTTEETGPAAIEDRNNPAVEKLVLFEDAPIAEEESLNAFEVLDSPAQVGCVKASLAAILGEEIAELVEILIDEVEPDAEAFFRFLGELEKREDRDTIGELLPIMGLFRHVGIVEFRRKAARPAAKPRFYTQRAVERIRENRDRAQRLGEFVDRAIEVLAGRRDEQRAGAVYVELLRFRDGHLTGDELVERLDFAELDDLTTRRRSLPAFVQMLIGLGVSSAEARDTYRAVKRDDVDEEGVAELVGVDELPVELRREMRRLEGTDHVLEAPSLLIGVLAVLRRQAVTEGGPIELVWGSGESPPILKPAAGGRLAELTLDVARDLIRATEAADSIDIAVREPGAEDVLGEFRILDSTATLDEAVEDWTIVDDETIVATAIELIGPRFEEFAADVRALRAVVDPPVGGPSDDDADEAADTGRNNDIYLAFDLVYLAERGLFRRIVSGWAYCASALQRRVDWSNAERSRFLSVARALAGFGLAATPDSTMIALPFHPLRLRKLIHVIEQVEAWISQALLEGRGRDFDMELVREQLVLRHLPRVAPGADGWLLEAVDHGFWSRLAAPGGANLGGAPMWKARAKLDQFCRVLPFARDRLQIASYPGGTGERADELFRAGGDAAAHLVLLDEEEAQTVSELERQILDPDAATDDLLVSERGEGLLPVVTFERSALRDDHDAEYHVAVLVDTFVQNEPEQRFEHLPPPLTQNDWQRLDELAALGDSDPTQFAAVILDGHPSLTAYAETAPSVGHRTLVYAPPAPPRQRDFGFEHDALSLLSYALANWAVEGNPAAAWQTAYHETYEWNAELLARLHDEADWVVMLDRFLDRRFFDAEPTRVKLIDFASGLSGGYKLSVSSARTHTVTLQLERAIRRCDVPVDEPAVAAAIVERLSAFAGGLLLKCIGGGALVEELLGLYATYRQLELQHLIDDNVLLIPVDEQQHWFGKRTSSRRRADLLLIRRTEDGTALHFTVIESKWRKPPLRTRDLRDMVGQIDDTRETLVELFSPPQPRLDDAFWRQDLRSVLVAAQTDDAWNALADAVGTGAAPIGKIDGRVFVHLHRISDSEAAAQVAAIESEDPERVALLRAFGREAIAAAMEV